MIQEMRTPCSKRIMPFCQSVPQVHEVHLLTYIWLINDIIGCARKEHDIASRNVLRAFEIKNRERLSELRDLCQPSLNGSGYREQVGIVHLCAKLPVHIGRRVWWC